MKGDREVRWPQLRPMNFFEVTLGVTQSPDDMHYRYLSLILTNIQILVNALKHLKGNFKNTCTKIQMFGSSHESESCWACPLTRSMGLLCLCEQNRAFDLSQRTNQRSFQGSH